MNISPLETKTLGLWGWGREGRAAYTLLRDLFPSKPLTVFCSDEEVAAIHALNDVHITAQPKITAEALMQMDVVIKSPGISPYQAMVKQAQRHGTCFIGGTSLWFAQHPDAMTLCVTGTKGKSTTTALLAHLLRMSGLRTALAGNIGVPLLELITASADVWAIELSSYQTRDVALSGVAPTVALVTNIYPEHLNWHGSIECYIEDKLALVTEAHPRIVVLNAQDPILSTLNIEHSEVRWFGHAQGWHLQNNWLYRGDQKIIDTSQFPLPGAHNRSNICGVMTVLEAIGLDAVRLAPHVLSFKPLPHRLQTLGIREGVTWVNDSISTTPYASLAALDVFKDRHVALLVGGYDRGIDWSEFAQAMASHAPAVIVTMGENGAKIHALLQPIAETTPLQLHAADTLDDAVQKAMHAVQPGSVLLLSPGAPSFGEFKDYVARGRRFAELGGFDPEMISSIQGMGIA